MRSKEDIPKKTAEEFIKRKYPQDWDEIPKWVFREMNAYASEVLRNFVRFADKSPHLLMNDILESYLKTK